MVKFFLWGGGILWGCISSKEETHEMPRLPALLFLALASATYTTVPFLLWSSNNDALHSKMSTLTSTLSAAHAAQTLEHFLLGKKLESVCIFAFRSLFSSISFCYPLFSLVLLLSPLLLVSMCG
jgi:hypothetical protein